MQGRSKKAFSKNVATEMDAGKPQAQSLAIAYDIKRKNSKKKKMAFGGKAEDTNEPPVPAAKADNERLPDSETMADHFAKGGTAQHADGTPVKPPMTAEAMDQDTRKQMGKKPMMVDEYNPNEDPANLAYGGMAEDDAEPSVPMRKPDDKRLPEDEYMADHFADGGEAEGHYDSVSEAIMAKKRKAKMMAEGGMVDLDENAMEEPNNLDDMNYEALKKENYAEEHGLSAMGSPEDSNEHGDELEDADAHDMVDSIRKKMKAKRG